MYVCALYSNMYIVHSNGRGFIQAEVPPALKRKILDS